MEIDSKTRSLNPEEVSLGEKPQCSLWTVMNGQECRNTIQFEHETKCVSVKVMGAVTVLSDFRAQENKICHCFHFLPTYLP